MKKITTYLAFLIGIFLLSNTIQAASLYFDSPSLDLGVRQEVEIEVRFNPEGQIINALEGILDIPDGLEVLSIKDGNSSISFWSERPSINESGNIVFAGIIPGGWIDTEGSLFSLIVVTTSEGDIRLGGNKFNLFLHDGLGTQIKGSINAINLKVDPNTPIVVYAEKTKDTTSPEEFALELATSTSIFDGDYFLVFSSQDKESGIDRYEVLESKYRIWNKARAAWVEVTSPYRLKDQDLGSYVYIKAIDKAGNERIAIYAPKKTHRGLFNGIILVGLLLIIWLWLYRFSRRRG